MAILASTDATARALLQTTACAVALAEAGIRVRSSRHTGGSRADRGSIVAVLMGIATGLLVAAWCATSVPAAGIPWGWGSFIAGLALMWAGIGLRVWAVLSLGRLFTVVVRVADEHVVVDHGPYRYVRHPAYTGLLLTLGGLGVALGSWLSVAALVIFPTAGLVVRIRVEEAALVAALGAPYREYAEHRRRLVPGIW
jgi:protein-S-isoprenylcysteine O-methyltransferase Ste14